MSNMLAPPQVGSTFVAGPNSTWTLYSNQWNHCIYRNNFIHSSIRVVRVVEGVPSFYFTEFLFRTGIEYAFLVICITGSSKGVVANQGSHSASLLVTLNEADDVWSTVKYRFITARWHERCQGHVNVSWLDIDYQVEIDSLHQGPRPWMAKNQHEAIKYRLISFRSMLTWYRFTYCNQVSIPTRNIFRFTELFFMPSFSGITFVRSGFSLFIWRMFLSSTMFWPRPDVWGSFGGGGGGTWSSSDRPSWRNGYWVFVWYRVFRFPRRCREPDWSQGVDLFGRKFDFFRIFRWHFLVTELEPSVKSK